MIIRTTALALIVATATVFASADTAQAAPVTAAGAFQGAAAYDWFGGASVSFPIGRRSYATRVTYVRQPIYGPVLMHDMYGNHYYVEGIIGYQDVPVYERVSTPRPVVRLGIGRWWR
jgi:hypothetical protein